MTNYSVQLAAAARFFLTRCLMLELCEPHDGRRCGPGAIEPQLTAEKRASSIARRGGTPHQRAGGSPVARGTITSPGVSRRSAPLFGSNEGCDEAQPAHHNKRR